MKAWALAGYVFALNTVYRRVKHIPKASTLHLQASNRRRICMPKIDKSFRVNPKSTLAWLEEGEFWVNLSAKNKPVASGFFSSRFSAVSGKG